MWTHWRRHESTGVSDFSRRSVRRRHVPGIVGYMAWWAQILSAQHNVALCSKYFTHPATVPRKYILRHPVSSTLRYVLPDQTSRIPHSTSLFITHQPHAQVALLLTSRGIFTFLPNAGFCTIMSSSKPIFILLQLRPVAQRRQRKTAVSLQS